MNPIRLLFIFVAVLSTFADLQGEMRLTGMTGCNVAVGELSLGREQSNGASGNHLNLPTEITWNGNSKKIAFTYDAGGTLLTRIASSGPSTDRRDFVGGIEYSGTFHELESIAHSEGRVYFGGGSERYDFALADHLGNTRILYADLNGDGEISVPTEIIQEEHYMPFGMKMAGPWMGGGTADDTRNQYNGIEHIDDFDLGVNMAFYRTLDPVVGRWWSVDPKAEHDFAGTPYGSMYNSPMVYVDPMGDEPITLAALAIGAIAGGIGGHQAGKAAGATGGQMLGYIFGGAAIGVASGYASFAVGAAATSSLGMVGGSAVAGAVGGATNSFLGQVAFTGSIDPGAVGLSALYGLGGGAASGLVDVSALADARFAMHHTVKHIARSTAFQVGGSLATGDFSFSGVNFGLDLSLAGPLLADGASLTSGFFAKKMVDNEKFKENFVEPAIESAVKPNIRDGEMAVVRGYSLDASNMRGDAYVNRKGELMLYGRGRLEFSADVDFGLRYGVNRLKQRSSFSFGLNVSGGMNYPSWSNANLLSTIYQNRRF